MQPGCGQALLEAGQAPGRAHSCPTVFRAWLQRQAVQVRAKTWKCIAWLKLRQIHGDMQQTRKKRSWIRGRTLDDCLAWNQAWA